MDCWEAWELSSDSLKQLETLNNKISTSTKSQDWLFLMNYKSKSDVCQMEVEFNEVDPKEEEILQAIKLAISSRNLLAESAFRGISINLLNRVLSKVEETLDDTGFCSFCQSIASWETDFLIEQSMRAIVLPKLQKTDEAFSSVILAIKELATAKPDHLCQNVLIPLVTDGTFPDVELFSSVFSALPAAQKDMLIMSFTKKEEFFENDWLLLYPLIKDLSQNSLTSVLECIQIFSGKFTKSQAFGRFLVNFCKSLDIIGCKNLMRDVIEKHETLLKIQALKYLEMV